MNGEDESNQIGRFGLLTRLNELIRPDESNQIGPVIFNPHTHHHLFASPSLSPHLPNPFSNLSLPRFLQTSSFLLPSTTTSVASQLSQSSSNSDRLLAHNSFQLLRCPGLNSTLAFFPTGSNSDQVGFVLFSVESSQLRVRGDHRKSEVFMSKNASSHRIFKILVNPLVDCDFTSGDSSYSTIGYLLACTSYSVYWYGVRIRRGGSGSGSGSGSITPSLELLASKLFKGSAVVHACWSPHLLEESLVLLENGEMILFDLNSCYGPSISSPRMSGKKLKVVWDQSVLLSEGGWLSCDFSWHPRVLIIAHSNAVFLVDTRPEKYKVSCLLKIDLLDVDHIVNDRFLAFCIAAPSRFYFSLSSNRFLFLCDLRKPMIPVLRWAHSVSKPSYVHVSSLSELRSQARVGTYSRASEAGYGVLLGSFWNCEFSLFCYGPDVGGSVSSKALSCSKALYAWGLPSDLSLVTHECRCGDCLVNEEFCKDRLPDWIDWQYKKEIVLGFGILDQQIASQLFEPDAFGGFTLVRLTSSGSLELQRYRAAWGYLQEEGHTKQTLDLEGSLLYESSEETYKFRKVFQYLKLNWLNGNLRSDLARNLARELVRGLDNGSQETVTFGQDFHESICQKLKKAFRLGGPQAAAVDVREAFRDVSLPTSMHEIALRSIWANLPKGILRLGFSTYSDLAEVVGNVKTVPFEFLEVPCRQPHLPPFSLRIPSSRSNKWSQKQTPSGFLVGPVVPVPFLMTLRKAHMLKVDNRSADTEIDVECDKVMRMTNELTMADPQICNDDAVSLADDKDAMPDTARNSHRFSSYKPAAFAGNSPMADPKMEDSIYEDQKYTNLIFQVRREDGKDPFDSYCPLKLEFNNHATCYTPKEMTTYKLLKRQYSNFKEGFRTYQDYMHESHIPR